MIPESLLHIAEQIQTQDNCMTRDPMFCVQVLERIGPIMQCYGSGNLMFLDEEEQECYYADDNDPSRFLELKDLHDTGDLPDHIIAASYIDKWFTIQTCFTENGCKSYLEEDGHNLQHYKDVRIYIESFHRNKEMQEIRRFLSQQQIESR